MLLEIKNLRLAVNGKEILRDISLGIPGGETHIIFGPNGVGKTSLLMAIIGMPQFKMIQGDILFDGRSIMELSIDERARLGIGMSFQRPPVVRGVKLRDIINIFKRPAGNMEETTARLKLDTMLDRDINDGFSGGEIKRSELLQLIAQQPRLALLDEPESGVDLENIALLGDTINELLEKREEDYCKRKVSALIITHTGFILDYVNADKGYVMSDGQIICEGNPRDLLSHIKDHGYGGCEECRCKK